MNEATDAGAQPFPFTAVVGNQSLREALLLNLVDPRIGGVLIRGDRGTAKSTLVRALADLLPPLRTRRGCPVVCDPDDGPCTFCAGAPIEQRTPRIVELPLGATEDRVAGTLDIEEALRSGARRFEPGLLAAAHRGVLYIDEVNLLPDHLVDLLLDVAASGVHRVEREGASVTHAARFLLVGTMNPEEGELRPQLLDRFGLVVEAHTPRDPALRAEVIRRRIAFDADPAAFRARFAEEQAALAARVARARTLLPAVEVPEPMLTLAVELCIEAQVDGLRPDLAVYRAAAARAALDDRPSVEQADVLEAALLALPHRQHRRPFDDPASTPSVESVVAAHRDEPPHDGPPDAADPARPPRPGDGHDDGGTSPEPSTDDGEADSGPRAPDRIDPAEAGRASHARLLDRPAGRAEAGGRAGRADSPRGRLVGHTAWDGASHDLATLATLRTAALRGRRRPTRADLRRNRRLGPARRLVLLLVDASGSMGAHERMRRTKSVLLTLLDQAYGYRDEVALQTFREAATPLLAGPTRDLARVRAAIEAMPVGGRTPLAAGIRAASTLLARERRTRARQTTLVLVTDGRTTEDIAAASEAVRTQTHGNLVIDTEAGPVRLGRARRLARLLDARYERLP